MNLLPNLFLSDLIDGDFFNERILMKTDVVEKGDIRELNIEVPGISKENIDISLFDGKLTIKVTNAKETKSENRYLCQERYYGEASRTFVIGREINEKDIAVELKDGILKISFPTVESKKTKETKKIEIK